MGDSDKLVGLKKAYAEIILNTSKEAAMRVMVAEKKSFMYQRELAESKEDALRMMVWLKQMMDSRICEADATALRQKSKIDELEAQLNEAEDIVKDLREELGIVRDELHDLRKKQSQQMSESEQHACRIVIQGQEEQREEIDYSISHYNQALYGQALIVAKSELRNLEGQRISEIIQDDLVSGPDMTRNVILSKEPKLLINGSSQGKHELANKGFKNDDPTRGKSLIVKDDSAVQEDCESSGKSGTQTSGAEVDVSKIKSNNRVKLAKKGNTQFCTKADSRRIKKSRRSSYLRKRQSLAKKILKSFKKISLMTSKANPSLAAVKEIEDQNDMRPSFKPVELCSKVEPHCTIQPCSQSTPESDKSSMGNVLNKEENGSTESSITCTDPENLCAPYCSIIEVSDELDTDGALQTKTDKSIPITFQRKRKKECMVSADGNGTVGVERYLDEDTLVRQINVESNAEGSVNGLSQQSDHKENTLKELKRSLKRKNNDKKDFKPRKRVHVENSDHTETNTIGIVPNATRDSRRLAQVARQLLSMSEKKRWD